MIVVVAGTIDVAPQDRERFLEIGEASTLATREEKGCIAYYNSADGIDPGRIHLFEIWESVEDLENHLVIRRSTPAPEGRPPTIERNIVRYEVSSYGPN